ncbi:MAG TPA: hypothetical protein ENI07_03085 [Desulfobacterales bacterium]|nr:hypothetical protein [Desulfobacterales bacterium]
MIPNWILENALNWFDPDEYLEANPDVASHPFWGLHPLWHFISSGYTEGRTWKGDPREVTVVQPSDPSEPTDPGTNSPQSHTVWVDKFSGDEGNTQISSSGDNPQYKRFGAVVYGGWPNTDKRYFYNTRHVESGVGHVEYWPELTGTYEIKWYFRKTANRAKTPCDVRLVTTDLTWTLRSVSQHADESDYASKYIGTVALTAGDYISCVPGDHKSISFGKMVFTKAT